MSSTIQFVVAAKYNICYLSMRARVHSLFQGGSNVDARVIGCALAADINVEEIAVRIDQGK
jgi:hypothetical protein